MVDRNQSEQIPMIIDSVHIENDRGQPQDIPVTTSMLAAKAKSKGELYAFLRTECNAYLPPVQTINIYFLRDVFVG